MKVFISWSGNKSHKVAMVFRDWLPSVIQSIVPYVSSEDIDKGARWSTDIAKELENSTFGILCVTKENLNAPWLSFEAGALSKTMDKSFVSPFLFDIKRSEVNGPILQFQSTVFQKEDIKKLIYTLNKACGESGIADARLEKSFDVWYPPLEQELNKLKNVPDELGEIKKHETDKAHTSEILEEILDLSRNNQKLLRNPDTKSNEGLEEVKKMLQEQAIRFERITDQDIRRGPRRFSPMIIEELLHMGIRKDSKNYFGILVILSMFKNDFPWIYDLGRELIDTLKSRASKNTKSEAVREFREMLEITTGHPMFREMYGHKKESISYLKELPYIINNFLEDILARHIESE